MTQPEPEPRLRPFSSAEARSRGLSAKQLRNPRLVRRLVRGWYVEAHVPDSVWLWMHVALAAMRMPIVASHLSALAIHGLSYGPVLPLHVSTNEPRWSRSDGITVHRRKHPISVRYVDGLPVTSPQRTFVDCAMMLPFPWLVIAGDHLIHRGLIELEDLADYVRDRHLDGVVAARRAVRFMCVGAESPMESLVRLMLVFARLPRPECNQRIIGPDGREVARVDMLFRAFKVIVEYDGRWHERSAQQRRRDRDRREQLEAMGYRVIVLFDTDLQKPSLLVRRVHEALVQHGYRGPAPVMSLQWHRWFAPR